MKWNENLMRVLLTVATFPGPSPDEFVQMMNELKEGGYVHLPDEANCYMLTDKGKDLVSIIMRRLSHR
jgi:Mn-dependent DtxR family transcriptional regulator